MSTENTVFLFFHFSTLPWVYLVEEEMQTTWKKVITQVAGFALDNVDVYMSTHVPHTPTGVMIEKEKKARLRIWSWLPEQLVEVMRYMHPKSVMTRCL